MLCPVRVELSPFSSFRHLGTSADITSGGMSYCLSLSLRSSEVSYAKLLTIHFVLLQILLSTDVIED